SFFWGNQSGKPQLQTRWLAEILGLYGVDVVRFFFKKGEEKIA
ncbi:unnamed protein product, partial [marine sediment metagenome]